MSAPCDQDGTHLVFEVQIKDYPQKQLKYKVRVLAALWTPGRDEGGTTLDESPDNFDLWVFVEIASGNLLTTHISVNK